MSAYAGHLANIQEKTQVVATEDIFSDRGVLIAKSGTEINKKTCQQLVKFKLLKPLEDTIFIANQLNAKAIFDQIIDLLNRDAYLKALNSRLGKPKALQACCLRLQKYPLIMQKLTVLDMEITDVFRQSLLSGYLAMICALQQQLPQDDVEEYFLAGITHDIGLLHIDRYILTKTETLTAEEWRKMQSHPVIGYEILKRINGFPKAVATAVLEHHENLDGSGYPRGKNQNQIGKLSQLINLLDTVIVIYQKKFQPLKRSMKQLIPILQMNMHSYWPDIVSIVFRVLKAAPNSPHDMPDNKTIKLLIDHIQEQQDYISQITATISKTNDDISFTHNNKAMYAIQNIAINTMVIINSAGLDHEELNWRESLDSASENNRALYEEIENTRLMQDEIIYLLQSYQKSASVFINQHSQNPLCVHLQKALQQFENKPRPIVPDALKQYWHQLSKVT